MNSKFFTILVLIGFFTSLLATALTVGYVDPFFHYHKPLASLQYPLDNQRYMNSGIVRNFDYNSLITGTSMTENFKTTEFDALFNTNSIKVPFSGAYYREIDENIKLAIKTNPKLKTVLRALDYNKMASHKDSWYLPISQYPEYLYNGKGLDDVYYLLNKDVVFDSIPRVLTYTKEGKITPSFDEYSNWNSLFNFNKKAVLKTYTRKEKTKESLPYSKEVLDTLKANIKQNVINTAQSNPNITFYIFFSPYSVLYWDNLNQTGTLNQHLQMEKIVIEQLLEIENIKLFSFSNNFELTTNLDNYKDIAHYSEDINSIILNDIYSNNYRLTKTNYNKYLKDIESFYTFYDYNRIFD